ncbi:MAG TPA: hypothetical protein VGQ38_15365 [Gaiellaceae bacterium]|jgi:hypothetical protein|nr:hypothetical protein [Gaiellaceae bacterium]
MAAVTLSKVGGATVAVLGGDLVMGLRGNWIAHVQTGSAPGPAEGDAVVIAVAANPARKVAAASFSGTVRRAGAWAGEHELVIVGGAGHLLDEIPGDDHVGSAAPVPLELVAERICRAAGEVLDASVPANLANYAVPRWTRAKGTPASAFNLLVQEFGLSWRVLDTGAIWVGLETWTALDARAVGYELEELPDDGTIRCASGGATLRPGVTVLGRRVTRVRYEFAGEVTAELLTSVSGDVPDVDAPLVYREQHGATVVDLNDDDTVDLDTDTDALPGLQDVPIRVGIPGARVLPQTGDRVRVAFDEASPQSPVARDFDQDPAAARGVARVGDQVVIGTLEISGGLLTFTPAFSDTPIGPASSVTLTGAILSGSDEVIIR